MVADVLTARTMLIRQCGVALWRPAQMRYSAAKQSTEAAPYRMFGMENWDRIIARFDPKDELITTCGAHGGEDALAYRVEEHWLVALLAKTPVFTMGGRMRGADQMPQTG